MAFKAIGLAAIALACAAPASAQDDSNAKVLKAVDAFMTSLNTKNADAMKAATTSEGMLAALVYGDKGTRVRFTSFAKTIEDIRTEPDTLNEVYWTPTVLVHRGIAVVWAPYSFDYNGKRSHCGVDVFNLLEVDGAWKVSGIQYTVEPGDCPKGR